MSAKYCSPLLILLILLLLLPVYWTSAEDTSTNHSEISETARLIKPALDANSSDDDAKTLSRLQSLAEAAAQRLGPDHIGSSILLASLKASKTIALGNRKETAIQLRRSL